MLSSARKEEIREILKILIDGSVFFDKEEKFNLEECSKKIESKKPIKGKEEIKYIIDTLDVMSKIMGMCGVDVKNKE